MKIIVVRIGMAVMMAIGNNASNLGEVGRGETILTDEGMLDIDLDVVKNIQALYETIFHSISSDLFTGGRFDDTGRSVFATVTRALK